MNKNKNKEGFTLIELMVSMVVIAVLVGLGFGAIREVQVRGRDTKRIADMRSVQTSLELYYQKCNRYPGDGSSDCSNVNGNIPWSGVTAALSSIMAANQVPKDPSPSGTYYYGTNNASGQEGLSYVVGSKLERDNSVLDNDVDGVVYGVDCGDPVYCVGS